jgi:hypothetical protein
MCSGRPDIHDSCRRTQLLRFTGCVMVLCDAPERKPRTKGVGGEGMGVGGGGGSAPSASTNRVWRHPRPPGQ